MKNILNAILLAAAAPLCALAQDNYSGEVTLRAVDLNTRGNQGQVREYENKQYDYAEGDLQLNANGKAASLDLFLEGLNSSEESGFFRLNAGKRLTLTGKLENLTHRQAFVPYVTVMNGQYVTPLLTYTLFNSHKSTATQSNLTNDNDMLFKRTETELKAVLAGSERQDQKIMASFWQEYERGNSFGKYSGASGVPAGALGNQVRTVDVDRRTTDLTVGIGQGVGEGAFSADFTRREYQDDSDVFVTSRAVTGMRLPIQVAKPEIGDTKMDLVDVRFRGTIGEKLPITGLLSSRIRDNSKNGFETRAYTANLASAYKLSSKARLNMRVYGRASSVRENPDYRVTEFGTTSGQYQNRTGAYLITDGIDRYNLAGELKGRYDWSDNLGFNAGVKYANNYRRFADHYTYEFDRDATYEDGTFISSNTQHSGVAVHEEKTSVSAGFEAALPWDISLEGGYNGTFANKAVFEGLPTETHSVDSGFSVPLPYNLAVNGSAGYTKEKNFKASMSDARMEQTVYQGGLNWEGFKVLTVGADYSYDRTSYRSIGYFSESNNVNNNWVINLMREPNMMYRFENQVYGYHMTAKLPYGFRLRGNASYTMSKGKAPVMLDNFTIGTAYNANGVNLTDLNPSDTRITSGRIALDYDYADWLAASVGFRQDEWYDNVITSNNGRYKAVDLSVTARF